MRRIWITLAATAVISTGVQLSAQSPKPVSIGLAVGAAIPLGDLSDFTNTGYNATASLGLTSVGTPIGLRLEGMYNKFLGRDDVGPNQPDMRVVAGIANLVYGLPGVGIRPYLIGGAGYYGVKPDVSGFESENKLGLNGGIGAMFPLSGFNAFVEARLHHVFTDVSSTQFTPVTIGILF
jgi:hypothetical protein